MNETATWSLGDSCTNGTATSPAPGRARHPPVLEALARITRSTSAAFDDELRARAWRSAPVRARVDPANRSTTSCPRSSPSPAKRRRGCCNAAVRRPARCGRRAAPWLPRPARHRRRQDARRRAARDPARARRDAASTSSPPTTTSRGATPSGWAPLYEFFGLRAPRRRGHDARRATPGVRGRRHLRHRQGSGLRLPARSHGARSLAHRSSRPRLRDRGRSRLHPDRRGARAARDRRARAGAGDRSPRAGGARAPVARAASTTTPTSTAAPSS